MQHELVEFHTLAELTKKNVKSSFSKRRDQLFTMTHTLIRVCTQIKKKQEGNTDDQKQGYKYKVTQGSYDNHKLKWFQS